MVVSTLHKHLVQRKLGKVFQEVLLKFCEVIRYWLTWFFIFLLLEFLKTPLLDRRGGRLEGSDSMPGWWNQKTIN
jgi:hypothetical protein